jgi:hypothetical protein
MGRLKDAISDIVDRLTADGTLDCDPEEAWRSVAENSSGFANEYREHLTPREYVLLRGHEPFLSDFSGDGALQEVLLGVLRSKDLTDEDRAELVYALCAGQPAPRHLEARLTADLRQLLAQRATPNGDEPEPARPAAVTGTATPRRRAYLVGCGACEALPKQLLTCPEHDVQDLAKVLRDPLIGAFDDVAVRDGTTGANTILSELEDLFQKAATRETVLFYFSGHGLLRHGRLYLCTQGTTEKKLDTTGIDIERVKRYAQSSASRSIVFVLDCCSSGMAHGVTPKGTGQATLESLADQGGFGLLAAASGEADSYEVPGVRNSVFTSFILEALQTGEADLNGDGVVTVDELYSSVFARVRAMGLQLQVPSKSGIAFGNIAVAKNPSYRPVSLSTADPSHVQKLLAARYLADAIRTDDTFAAMLTLTRYTLDGKVEARASGLTVSKEHTPNLLLVPGGIECDAFFTRERLTPSLVEGKTPINGLFRVRLKVDYDDLLGIAIAREKDAMCNLWISA